MGRTICALSFALPLFAWPRDTSAQIASRIEWRQDYRRVGIPEYILAPSLMGGHLIIRFTAPPAEHALWTRPLLFDAAVRDILRQKSDERRRRAATVSDVTALLSLAQPLLFDTVAVAGLGRDSWDVAWQMEVIGAQSYSLTLLVNDLSKRLFGRARPYVEPCADDPDYSDQCGSSGRYRSFYSGHAAITATGSGLTCAHHTHVPLYGGGWWDRGACLASLGMTLLTGALRISSDRHWATDVFTGHLVGFSTGYLIPTLFYYRSFHSKPPEDPAPSGQVAQPILLRWGGQF